MNGQCVIGIMHFDHNTIYPSIQEKEQLTLDLQLLKMIHEKEQKARGYTFIEGLFFHGLLNRTHKSK